MNKLLNRILNEYWYYCISMKISTKIYNPKKGAFGVFKWFDKLQKWYQVFYLLCFQWIDEHLDFVLYRYSVVDLAGDAKYMINAKLEVCLESGQPCLISHDIAKDLYLPKIGCDWSLDFSSKWSRLVIFLPMIQLIVLWHSSSHVIDACVPP